jgi:hypothetical protein
VKEIIMNYRNKKTTSGGKYTMKTTTNNTPSNRIRNNNEKAINRLKQRGIAGWHSIPR